MNALTKIQPRHLNRLALVYIRQSTPKQVQTNQESTRRQYALADKAQQWGWPQPQIQIIDTDLGLSGASSIQRTGFQQLLASISLGEVGIVLVTEVSRLSRLNSDWHRVLELCAVFQTLLADEDGIYDPRDPNDRLLLGLKGTLFAAELHILQERMRGGLLNKAKRGELALPLPVGYRRLPDGTVVQDPDEQVRHTIQLVFDQFAQLHNARAVQRYFHQHGLLMPRLMQHGLEQGQIRWVTPSYLMIYQILTSPVYAGVFVYGRYKSEIVPGDPPKQKIHRQAMADWEIRVPGIYPAYLSFEQYQQNRRWLQENTFSTKTRGAVREGRSLLQGILYCGRCGRRMAPKYGAEHSTYVCQRAQVSYDAPRCQSFPMSVLDQAIGEVFLQAVQPAQLETMLAALELMEQERQTLERQWQLRLERARYQAHLAQKQYDAVDPDNRLVARELEKRWNDALLHLGEEEKAYTQATRNHLAPVEETDREAIRALASDLPALWQASTTTAVDRKRLLRLVVQEVHLTADPKTRSATYRIIWSGGTTTSHTVACPPLGQHQRIDAQLLQEIAEMATYLPDHLIAERLNADSKQTKTGKVWTYQRVQVVRREHHLATACPLDSGHSQSRGDGLMPVKKAAKLLNVSTSLITLWAKQGVLQYDQRIQASKLWVSVTPADQARLDGSTSCADLPTFAEVMRQKQITREQVWQQVRAGQWIPYRFRHGGNWEWRLQSASGAQ